MLEPVTDREVMIALSGKIDITNKNIENLCVSINGIAKSLENLETIKVRDHETRVNELEKWRDEFSGAYKVFAIIATGLSIVSIFVSFVK
jgi:hypothetical protein